MPRRLIVQPQQTPLRGSITVPGDKSISHRALMLAAIADGESDVRGWLPAGDTLATLAAIRALGVTVKVVRQAPQAWDLRVVGRGRLGLTQPERAIDCANAGSLMRLIAGILVGQPFPSILDGSPQLRGRPMGRIIKPLSEMGGDIRGEGDCAPLHIKPAKLGGIRYQMPVASAQVKSALLLAGLYADGEVAVHQPGAARDHTERMLRAMGLTVTEAENGWVTLPHQPDAPLRPLDLDVPGDMSSAAFPMVAAGIVPHSQITINGVSVNPTRAGILELLGEMGVEVSLANHSETGGEPTASLTVQFSEMHGVTIGGGVVVRAIDEFPILTVAASQSAGETILSDAAELRVKEVDRIDRLATELAKMGAAMIQRPDGYTLTGPVRLRGARVDSHGDHRLGMALAVAGLIADTPTIVENAGSIADSFPDFVKTMRQIGADMRWQTIEK